MHQAPPVAYPLGSTQYLCRWVAMAWAVVITTDLFWLFQAQWHDWKLWLGLALTVLAGAFSYRFWPVRGNGVLQWGGSGWIYREGERETAGHVTVHLDLQFALLVFWAPVSGPGDWHWLRSAAEPTRWLAFRRAAFASDRSTQDESDGAESARVTRP